MTQTRRQFVFQSAATLAAAGFLPARAWAAETPVEAETAFGRIRGVDVDGIKTFKAIPYGASTAGRNRFKPPMDPAKWTGVRDALAYGPSAPQRQPGTAPNTSDLAVAGAGMRQESEDCLVLNVWTPALGDNRKRPVMVWCHGGGFATGSGSSPITEGEALARRGDVVVVTLNHRLNVMGFTFLEEAGGAEFAGSGDAGMLDIVHALKWVRDNIGRFGGDAGNVTVFGQSGGGRKVATLLAMPAAKGLFHRAIIESGATLKLVERDQAARVAAELMKTLGVSRGQRARAADAAGREDHGRLLRHHAPDERGPDDDGLLAHRGWRARGAASVPPHGVHRVSVGAADARVRATELTSSAAPALFSLGRGQPEGADRHAAGRARGPVLTTYRKTNPDATPSDLYFLIASDHRYSGPAMQIAERRAAPGAGTMDLRLPLGDAGRRRQVQVAAHDRDPVRVRQREARRADR